MICSRLNYSNDRINNMNHLLILNTIDIKIIVSLKELLNHELNIIIIH